MYSVHFGLCVGGKEHVIFVVIDYLKSVFFVSLVKTVPNPASKEAEESVRTRCAIYE